MAFRGIPGSEHANVTDGAEVSGGQWVHQAWLSDWDWESLTGQDVKSLL